MAGATPLCIFCARARVTEEHLIPDWMLIFLTEEFNWPGGRSGLKIGSQEPIERTITTKPEKAVARCVCARCNNEWMSVIEQAAKPTLISMIRGESIELDPPTQTIVATWMCLKAIVGAYVNLLAPVPEEWPKYLYLHHSPPPENWTVYTARFVGTLGLTTDCLRTGTRPAGTVPTPFTATTDQDILTTFIIGQLAIQALGRLSPLRIHDRVNLLPLWPASALTLRWPPDVTIGEGNLEEFRSLGFPPHEPLYTGPE